MHVMVAPLLSIGRDMEMVVSERSEYYVGDLWASLMIQLPKRHASVCFSRLGHETNLWARHLYHIAGKFRGIQFLPVFKMHDHYTLCSCLFHWCLHVVS